jgi:molybdopterin-binding protein
MPDLKPSEAARRLGVSYATLKQWIYTRRIRVSKTPGGHYRVPDTEIKRLQSTTGTGPQISGRNQLRGRVVAIEKDRIMASVTLAIGEQRVQAIITRAAVDDLKLKVGDEAFALIKATEVMIMR